MTMDIPNLGGNAFFLACHAVLLFPQIYLGLRHKTWGFLFGMFCGHVLEIIGYVARIRMHNGEDGFLMYIVTLTIGPAFFSASIYLCLARIITVYGEGFSRFSPRTYTITFMISDFIALVFQAAGGSILGGDDPTMTDTGLAIIKTGLAAHLAAISIFVILASELGFRIYRHQDRWNPKFDRLQRSWRFNMFLICLGVATLCILIRTSYRVAELSGGYDSKLANDEVAFMILEGAMIVVSTVCLAVGHPGICFEGRWDEANFQLRKRDDSGEFGKAESDPIN
ncbi:RTA [Fusarium albosuccineum]|uniref:RTA n=1 Tax=Fusarium albosuccineum TaxID=1237068 RepID=A0A8H4PJI4_9HYPO|nr:RTA [Fusarium albosuccineum]